MEKTQCAPLVGFKGSGNGFAVFNRQNTINRELACPSRTAQVDHILP